MKTIKLSSMERLVIKFSIFGILLLSTLSAAAQKTPTLEVSMENVLLSEILKEIEIKAKVSITYSDAVIDGNRRVSLNGKYTISQALDKLFTNTDIGYKQMTGRIVLFKKIQVDNLRYSLSGYIMEKESGELLPFTTIYIPSLGIGVSSNSFGFYSVLLPADSISIIFSFIGYETQTHAIQLKQDTDFNVHLTPSNLILNEVTVKDEEERISGLPKTGHISVPIAQIKTIPVVLGERDILKTLQLLPGVKRGTEGFSGLFVRGGGADQNLVLLDDAPVYNAFHLFGFFSVFNGNAIKSVDLLKGGFPARYGGRLSSVLDMRMKEGDKHKFHGDASIGLISSNFTVHGPLKKDKASILISARRSYYDLAYKPFAPENRNLYYFYDFNAKVNYSVNSRNKVYLSGYFGKDDLDRQKKHLTWDESAQLWWANRTVTLRWNHQLSDRVFGNLSLIYSSFNLNSNSNHIYQDTVYKSQYISAIRDLNFKYDADIYVRNNHTIKGGANFIWHQFKPGGLIVKSGEEQDDQNFVQLIDAYEAAIYVEDEFRLTEKFSANAGIRLTDFNTQVDKMKINVEPRAVVSYQFAQHWSAKANYSRMYQYIHLLGNTGLGLPSDLWVPSTEKVPRQKSDQTGIGLTHDLTEQEVTISLEGYYKQSENVVAYKEGSTFLGLDRPTSEQVSLWEDNVASGNSSAYGVELFVQKKTGRLNGWIGYTLSWVEMQFDEINFGKKFFAHYDRRHDLSLVGVYTLTEKITLSGSWIWQTGNRVTVPTNQFAGLSHYWYTSQKPGSLPNIPIVTQYSPKNSFQTPIYHRLDIGIQLKKKKRRYEQIWEFGLYNTYYRKNPLYYKVVSENSRIYLSGVNVFPIIPSVSYHIKF